MKVGFIGQGWIGKNYADDFERRGFNIVRYGQEEQYKMNGGLIQKCDMVFIAVPTPTVSGKGFDDSIVRSVMPLIGEGKTAVIKSTILPGTTESIQTDHKNIIVLHSPEFLSEATAAEDASNPVFNIVGVPEDSERFKMAAQSVLKILPKARSQIILSSREAELFKYMRNCFFYTKVVYMNLLYNTAEALNCRWSVFKELMRDDPWIAPKHLDPVHKTGRGAGGNCFIKDFAAFISFYKKLLPRDSDGIRVLEALEEKNMELLTSSGKNLNKVSDVYGNL